jgi:imidazolonepropionase-like amidohydrolase
MMKQDISKAKNPDLRASLNALHRAAEAARQTAIRTDTAIVIVQDGRIVRVTAEELKKEAAAKDVR